MKKTFVKVSLLSMMLTALPVAMTSCKDYDDDITEINGTTDALSSQIAAINSAIEANKQSAQSAHDAADAALKAAQEAAAKGDQAEADAQKAMAVAKSAEEAAAKAKADALAEIALVAEAVSKNQASIEDNEEAIQANKDAIAALVGRIEGVENGLANIDLDDLNASIVELNTALQAVNTQLEALKGFETRLGQLESQYAGISSEVAAAKTDIANVKNELTSLKSQISALSTDVNANKSAISELRTDLATLSQEISTKVQNGVNTIAGVVGGRLTSVTLMPDLYVGGIPTIEFKSAQYNSLEWKNGKWVESSSVYRVSNNQTEIEYRLNPGSIQNEDINLNELAFVSRIATTRAPEVDNDIISVISGEVGANGVLKLKAGKSTTGSLNLSGNKIYTVSLKVPIAKKHLFEKESSANVYSEYTRLSEIYFTPKLQKTGLVASAIDLHFNDSTAVYQSGMNKLVAAKVQYNKTLDLNTLVEGCAFQAPDTHSSMTLEELRGYGFEVSYTIATRAYNTLSADKANQQEFAHISGATFTPGAPSGSSWAAGNQAAIGKQPIVHVWLKDVKNKKLVDSRYFKVLITREDPTPLAYTITPAKEQNLACGPYTWNVTWDEITKQVLSQFPGNGISKEDFFHRYGAHAADVTVKVNGVDTPSLEGNVTDQISLDNTGASVPVMSFTLTNEEIGKLAQNKSKTYTVTLTYKDQGDLNPAVSITFTCVVKNNIANPTIGRVDPIKWGNNETMLLYPIPYGSANAQQHAEYNTNILEGRYSPLATGFIPCATWNLAFASSYNGASMTFPAGFGGWMTPTLAGTLNNVEVAIAHNAAGIALVSSEANLGLKWNVRLNGIAENEVNFANSTLKIVKPLENPTLDNSVRLNDQAYQQTVNLGDKFSLTDAFGNTVANTSGMAKNLYDYYGVTSVVFGGTAGDIMVTNDMNGSNPRSLASLNMTADVNASTNVLTFHNGGAPLRNDCYLQIPVAISHYWGTLTGKLYIKIVHTL